MKFEFDPNELHESILGLELIINSGKPQFKRATTDLGLSVPSKHKITACDELLSKLKSVTIDSGLKTNLTPANFKRLREAVQVIDYLVCTDNTYGLIVGATSNQLQQYVTEFCAASHGKKALQKYFLKSRY